MRSVRPWIWGLPFLAYVVFWLWYTPLSGPMTAEEVDRVVAWSQDAGDAPETTERFRRFFEEDDGRAFLMVNLIDMADMPRELPATGPGADAGALLDHYMEYMYTALLARASHPVFAGRALSPSLDLVGIEGAEVWEQAVLMRYRSRRDLWEIASHPSFLERHEYKLAALEKTIAFPVTPALFLSDPRLLLALLLLAVAGLLDTAFVRRR